MKKKIGVILSGSGVYDGSEIHEAVAILAALDNHCLEAHCFAPDIKQMHVINHLTGEVMEEERNVLVESARIARGEVKALTVEAMEELDGVIIPGGFGAAKNLSDYAVKGSEISVEPTVQAALEKIHSAAKPIAALCISPVILSKIFGGKNPKLTLGAAGDDAANIEKHGSKHQVSSNDEAIVDAELKLVTGPCYMLDSSVGEVMRCADLVVGELRKLLAK